MGSIGSSVGSKWRIPPGGRAGQQFRRSRSGSEVGRRRRYALVGLLVLLGLCSSRAGAQVWTFDEGFEGWLAEAKCGLTHNWRWVSEGFRGTLYATNPDGGNSSMILRSGPQSVVGAHSVDVTVSHRFDTESCCDHGYIVYRLDGGAWQRFEPHSGDYNIFDFMYNDPLFGACGSSPDMDVFAGDSGGYIETKGRMYTQGASTLELAFLFSSDASFVDDGWYIDSVTFEHNLPIDCSGNSASCDASFNSSFGGWLSYPECDLQDNGSWVPAMDGERNVLLANQPNSGDSSMMLISPPISVAPNDLFELSFAHQFNTETCCDHGYVAFREDGGAWQQLEISRGVGYNVFDFMYNDPLLGGCGSSPDMDLFAGDSAGYVVSGGTGLVQSGSVLEVAFLYTSDASFVDMGWSIDDVSLSTSSSTSVFADGFETGDVSRWSSSSR